MSFKRRIVKHKEVNQFLGKQIMVLERHEQMLQTLDKYLEKIEGLLISKNIVTRAELDKVAEEALQPKQSPNADPKSSS